MAQELKQSPLNRMHVELDGRMVPFAGWEMPVQYEGIIPEHKAVRQHCGVFDISHMGQVLVSGPQAGAWLNHLLTNDVRKLDLGEGQYSLMLNESGGVIDDLILYRVADESYFLVINASKRDEDVAWMQQHLEEGVDLEDQSDGFAAFAIQGPETPAIFKKMLPDQSLPQRNGISQISHEGNALIVCRTGYTGEDGFEFFCPSNAGEAWFQKILDAGATPCGLGARDSLRLEMGFPLNGSDLSPDRTPLEAGLGFFVKLNKGPFIGSSILAKQKEDGLKTKLCAFQLEKKGPPLRSHYSVENSAGETIGEVASGTMSPSLGIGIGMAYLPLDYAVLGTSLFINIRGRQFPATIVKKPFYKKNS